MRNTAHSDATELEALETREWLESLEYVLKSGGPARVGRLLRELGRLRPAERRQDPVLRQHPLHQHHPRRRAGAATPATARSSAASRASSAGTRWRWWCGPTRVDDGIGGHISTFASAATLYEVAFNHFFRGRDDGHAGDMIYFQGHASPGMYARAFLEGRLDEEQLEQLPPRAASRAAACRRYPHPWLMPDFWEFPTVSMGLGPIMAIYQARFNPLPRGSRPQDRVRREGLGVPRRRRNRRARIARRHHAGLAREARQPDLRHQLQPAAARRPGARQRQDHPGTRGRLPRRRLERHQGASGAATGTRCSSKDDDGLLVKRMGEVVDGEYQKYAVETGRLHPRALLRHLPAAARAGQAPVRRAAEEADARRPRSGEGLRRLQGAPPRHKGKPTVILAHTIKGYGLGEAGEGKNITHQQKKLNEDELHGIPHPLRHSDLRRGSRQGAVLPSGRRQRRRCKYLRERRAGAGRLRAAAAACKAEPLQADLRRDLRRVLRRAPTAARRRPRWCSCACCRSCCATRRSASSSCRSCPTKRAPSAWKRCSARSASTRTPASSTSRSTRDTLLYYKEATDGQILEEGITEAGSMSSFIAAGTAYATHGVNTIPFYIYYSMFGFQRVGDLIWAAADMRDARLPARRHRRPHHAQRRRPAAPGRPQPPAGAAGAELPRPTTRRTPTSSPSSSRTASGACIDDEREHLLLPHRDERALRACRRCRRASQDGILKGHVHVQAHRASPRPSCARSCSAAAPS